MTLPGHQRQRLKIRLPGCSRLCNVNWSTAVTRCDMLILLPLHLHRNICEHLQLSATISYYFILFPHCRAIAASCDLICQVGIYVQFKSMQEFIIYYCSVSNNMSTYIYIILYYTILYDITLYHIIFYFILFHFISYYNHIVIILYYVIIYVILSYYIML